MDFTASLEVDWSDAPSPVQTKVENATVADRQILLWLKGAKFVGKVTGSGADVANWHVGLIQILGTHTMEAKFKKGNTTKSIKWTQKELPCYDSGATTDVPWYNIGTGSRADAAADAEVSVTHVDYPTMGVALKLGDNVAVAGRVRDDLKDAELVSFEKTLRFSVFLAAGRKTATPANLRNAQNMLLLKQTWWSTTIKGSRTIGNWQVASKYGVTVETHERKHADAVTDVSGAATVLLPPASAGVANGSMNVRLA